MSSEPKSQFEESQFDQMTPRTWAFGTVMVLLGALGVYLWATRAEEYPYLTIFFYSIPSNAGISVFPHEPLVVWYGKFVNLWLLSVYATAGTILAAFLDYKFFAPVLNLSYSAKYKKTTTYQKAHKWFFKMPFVSIVVAGFSPIPFYPFKFMVYASKYSLWKYLLAVTIGRFPRYYLLGAAGFLLQIPDWLIIGSFVAMFVIIYYKKIFRWLSRSLVILYRLVRGKPLSDGDRMSKSIPTGVAISVGLHTLKNIFLNRPICVALEVTHNCTANCFHCDKGPQVEDNMVSADKFKRVIDEMSPPFIQIAGGEPMLRKDLPEIVRKLHRPGKYPLLVLITNASLMTVEKYHELREAGISQFSISLDFPDDRHDKNRSIPGLFDRMNKVIPELVKCGHGDVTINSCITRDNYKYIKDMVAVCRDWKAKMNFSVYTDLRTHNKDLNLRHPEDTQVLNRLIDELYADPELAEWTMTAEKVLRSYCRFFEDGMSQPNCQAGYRFLVVNPDGQLTPCAMFIDTRYKTREELVEKFSKHNTCDGCYISTRGNTEKTLWQLLTDNLAALRLSNRVARS